MYIIGTATGVASLIVMNPILNATDYLAKTAENSSRMILGALLALTMGLALAFVPIVAYPIFKKFNETLAIGYLVFRGGLETIAYIGLVISRLMLIPLSRTYIEAAASEMPGLKTLGAMLLAAHEWINILLIIVFALDALMLYAILFQSRLVPRWISIWGIIAILMHFVTSLLPIAAEYRAAFSNWSIQTVWVDSSLLAGMIIGFWVSYSLLRFFKKIPTKNPIIKSMILSSIALVIAIILIDVPMFPSGTSDAFIPSSSAQCLMP